MRGSKRRHDRPPQRKAVWTFSTVVLWSVFTVITMAVLYLAAMQVPH